PQPNPSPQSPSSVTSLSRVLACEVAAPSVVPGRVIGQKRIARNVGPAHLDAKCGMAVPCLFHRNCLLGTLSLFQFKRFLGQRSSPASRPPSPQYIHCSFARSKG